MNDSNEKQDSSILNAEYNVLSQELKQLKSLFETPRIYLVSFFNDLRHRVDSAFSCKEQYFRGESRIVLERDRINVTNMINSFEQDCLKKQRTNAFNQEITTNTCKLIENMQKQIEGLVRIKANYYGNETESDREEIKELYDSISSVIYDEKIQIEKIVFLNKTLLFLNKNEVNLNKRNREEKESVAGDATEDASYLDDVDSQSEDEDKERSLFDYYDSDTLVGIVLNIENDFIGHRGFDYFKNNKLEKLTNEVIKCKEIKKKLLKQESRDKLIRNVSIDLSLIKEVNFSRHQLRSIDRKAFAGFINLSKINLRKNKLTVINTVDLFSGLLNLQEINLYGNQLEFLYSEVFKGLANLKKLDLSDNKLQVLDCNIFRGLLNLEELNLSSNQLTSLTNDLFSDLIKLNRVWLSNNNLSYLGPRLFRGLSNLTYINLRRNRLDSLDYEIFKDCLKIKEINLHDNLFTDPDYGLFNGLIKLKRVWLSFNKILSLDPMIFICLDTLQELNLYGNRLSKLDQSILFGRKTLKSIDLSFNQLTEIHVGTFRYSFNLISIYMSNNRLSYLDTEVFDKLTKLKILDLSNNLLSEVSKSLFAQLSSLTHINLSNNQLATIDSNAFSNLNNLSCIDLSHNKLKSLEHSFFLPLNDKKQLKEINFKSNLIKSVDELIMISLKSNENDMLNDLNSKSTKINLVNNQLTLIQNKCYYMQMPIDWNEI